MAVQVVERPSHPPKRIVCKNCGCTCSYIDADVQKYSGTDMSGGPDGREWITCAGCNDNIIIRSW